MIMSDPITKSTDVTVAAHYPELEQNRTIWQGSIEGFIDLFDDGNPFERWGIQYDTTIRVVITDDNK